MIKVQIRAEKMQEGKMIDKVLSGEYAAEIIHKGKWKIANNYLTQSLNRRYNDLPDLLLYNDKIRE